MKKKEVKIKSVKQPSKILIVLGLVVLLGVIVFATKNQSSSTTPVPTPTENKTSQTSLTPDEETQILAASTTIVKANTEEGYKYTLSIKKHVKDYVRVDVTPGEGEMIDPAQVILQKEDGVWKAVTFGTSFPDMYDKVPELFQ
jgi:hypothetical protein